MQLASGVRYGTTFHIYGDLFDQGWLREGLFPMQDVPLGGNRFYGAREKDVEL